MPTESHQLPNEESHESTGDATGMSRMSDLHAKKIANWQMGGVNLFVALERCIDEREGFPHRLETHLLAVAFENIQEGITCSIP